MSEMDRQEGGIRTDGGLREAAIDVVRKAYFLLDDTEDDGLDEMRIDRSSWDQLSAAMDLLESFDPTGEHNCISAVEAALLPAAASAGEAK